MTEPIITCPNCKTEIRLTESLAAPLIAATRQQFEKQIERVMGATVGMYGDLQEIAGLILPFEGGKTVASRCRQAHLMSLSIG